MPHAIVKWQRHLAKRTLGLSSVEDVKSGSVTFIQRFGSAANLNVHFHTLVPDGVFVRLGGGKLAFRGLCAPTKEAI